MGGNVIDGKGLFLTYLHGLDTDARAKREDQLSRQEKALGIKHLQNMTAKRSEETLLASVDPIRSDQKGAVVHFHYPIASENEITQLIEYLTVRVQQNYIQPEDVIIRTQDGAIINNNPAIAIGLDTLVFSDTAVGVILLWLKSIKKDDETSNKNRIYYNTEEEGVKIVRYG